MPRLYGRIPGRILPTVMLARAAPVPLRWISTVLGVSASVTVHLFIAAVLGIMGDPTPTVASPTLTAPVSLEVVSSDLLGRPDGIASVRPAAPLVAGGPTTLENRSAYELGRGGDATGATHVMQLINRVDSALLLDAPWNTPRDPQLQRIRTANDRATPMDQRATPHPADDAFLASGDGIHRERRDVASRDARTGAEDSPAAGQLATARLAATDDGLGPAEGETNQAEVERSAPGRGIAKGTGARASSAARVAHGRPDVTKGYATTPTDWDADRVRDNLNANQLANQLTPATINASPQRSLHEGPGVGGAGPSGAPGLGEENNAGGRALARALGPGEYASLGESDPGYARWIAEQRKRVRRHLRFPEERQLAMDQGTAVYRFLLHRDGSPVAHPDLIRSSGFADLDAAARTAIERALPFSPVPDELAPDFQLLQIIIPVAFVNPMVH